MKTSKKRIAVSILTVFMMVFSVIPYMGAKADVAYAASAEEFTISETITGISKANNGQTVYTKTFYADNTVGLTMNVEHYSYSYQDYYFKLKLYGPTGAEVTPTSGNGYIGTTKWASSKFATAGNYTLKLTCGYTGLASGVGYKITGSMVKDKVYTYKFASLSARQSDTGRVFLDIGTYDGPSTNLRDINQAMYRVGAGKIRQVSWNDAHGYTDIEDDGNIEYATAYTYYVVNLDKLSAANKSTLSAVGSSSVTLTSAHQTALADPYVTKSNTITTKDIEIAPITGVEVVGNGVRSVTLAWLGGGDGYQLKSYDSKGTLRATVNTDYLGGAGTTKIYVAYAGQSKVTIQPYIMYNGQKKWGDKVTVSGLTSKKLVAKGGHVTKISNTKASLTLNRSADAKGIQIQQKKGTKWVNVATAATAKQVRKTWTKNNAGKTNYRFREYLVDKNGVKYFSAWRVVKPQVNQGTWPARTVSGLYNESHTYTSYFFPTKVVYSNGKVKVTGKFYNTGVVTRTCKAKVTFKVDGKVIGTKTISSKISGGCSKTTTFTLNNSVKGKDLYHAGYTVKYLQRH